MTKRGGEQAGVPGIFRGALGVWFSNWAGWVTTCMLWGLCQVTIVLGPPATFALAQTAQAAVFELPTQLGELVAAGRRFFWPAWGWAAPNLLLGGLLWAGFSLSARLAGPGFLLARVALWLVALAWFVLQYYTLPIFMLQEKKNLARAWQGSARLVRRAPGLSLGLAAVALLILVPSSVCITPLALGVPGLLLILASQVVIKEGPWDED